MKIEEIEMTGVYRSELFLDMDGVLADFFGEYAKLAGVNSYREIPAGERDPILTQIEKTDFFAKLPKFASTDKLVELAIRTFGHYNICSSPLRNDERNSSHWKKVWIKKNLIHAPKRIVLDSQKGKYAVQPDKTPNILVDDRGSVLAEWEKAGGIGIKYQADEDSLEVVIAGLTRAFRILKGEQPNQQQGFKSLDRKTGTIVGVPGEPTEPKA